MGEGDSDEAIAHGIAARRWGACDAIRLLGQGSNNVVYLAEGTGEKAVIKLSKPHRESGALAEYRKEAWCAAEAGARGVHTPPVLEFGVFETRAFAVQAFVDGTTPTQVQALSSWRALGEEARRINAVPTLGWGVTLHDGMFTQSWPAHLDYNIGALDPADPLRARGVLDVESSGRLQRALKGLRPRDLRFGLCHGDISLHNTLIDSTGTPWLIDWGCAFAHVVPHYEINEILRGPKPEPEALAAFLGGYGISQAAYDAMMPDLLALAALREVDTLRWAIDRQKHDVIADLSVRAKAAVARLE